MGHNTAAPASDVPARGATGTISVKVDPRLRREFAASCQLRGETIQAAFHRMMAATVAETLSPLRSAPTARHQEV